MYFQKNDQRNGKGTYVFANGSRYTGRWEGNHIHNKGRFDFANGSHYRGIANLLYRLTNYKACPGANSLAHSVPLGMFNHNSKHGKGIFTWPNGNEYKGEFVNEKLCGFGEMNYSMAYK